MLTFWRPAVRIWGHSGLGRRASAAPGGRRLLSWIFMLLPGSLAIQPHLPGFSCPCLCSFTPAIENAATSGVDMMLLAID